MPEKKETAAEWAPAVLPILLDGLNFWSYLGVSLTLLTIAFFFAAVGLAQMPEISAFFTFFLLFLPATLLGGFMFMDTLARHPRQVAFTGTGVEIQYPLRRLILPLALLEKMDYRILEGFSHGQRRDFSALTIYTRPRGRHRLLQRDFIRPFYGFLPHWRAATGWSLEWIREPAKLTPADFSNGSQHPFTYYLDGESDVPVHSVAQLCHWLQGCRYISDLEQFGERDVWLHPGEFERRKAGDCEDHALWAWRKLVEIGLPAFFVVGLQLDEAQQPEAHAWVVFKQENQWWLLETTSKRQPLRTLAACSDSYLPRYGVDSSGTTFRYMMQFRPALAAAATPN